MIARVALLVVLAPAMLAPAAGKAFERSMSESYPVPLWWDSREITMLLNHRCSDEVPAEFCPAAIRNGLVAWNEPACSDFRFVFGGLTAEEELGYDPDNPGNNINLIKFTDSHWTDIYTRPEDAGAIAITTTIYVPRSGEIVDADVDFNSDIFHFTSWLEDPDSPDRTRYDIQNIMAHEAGHVLGLDDLRDASDRESTMYGYAEKGDLSKMDLAPDDIDGLCTIYPAGKPTNRKLDYLKAPGPGCACSSRSGVPGAGLWLLLILATAGMSRACRRRAG